MYGKKQRPSWWLLYLSLPMMILLFLIEMRLSLSSTGHQLVEIIIVLVVFGYMSVWLKANTGALIREDLERRRAALRPDSNPISPQSVEILRTHGHLNCRPRRTWKSILRRLSGWVSFVAGFFH